MKFIHEEEALNILKEYGDLLILESITEWKNNFVSHCEDVARIKEKFFNLLKTCRNPESEEIGKFKTELDELERTNVEMALKHQRYLDYVEFVLKNEGGKNRCF